MVAPSQAVTKSAAALLEAVDRFHRENPLLPGIPKQDLRTRVGKPRLELFDAALGNLPKRPAVSMLGVWCSAPGEPSRFRRKKSAPRK